jgi:farnesyl-diphosphate farnesyltransferase
LATLGLAPTDLLKPSAIARLRPLLDDLLATALNDYDAAWAYTRAIPRTEMRLRLACAWPMFIGLQTLQRLRQSEDLLNPTVTTKIPRAAVYRMLISSGAMAWSDTWLAGRYRALKRPLADLTPQQVLR